MRCWVIWLTWCWVQGYASAVHESNSGDGIIMPPGVVAVELSHTYPGTGSGIHKRDNNNIPYGSYSISFSVGTPSQNQQGMLDTAAADVFVRAPSAATDGDTNYYNPYKSSTFDLNATTDFVTDYGSETVRGMWMHESLRIAGVNLTSQLLGLAMSETSSQPVFGIGPKALSACNGSCSTVTESLRNSGLTQVEGYSLYLDNLSKTSTGRILFGGINHYKYNGTLQPLSFVNESSLATNVTKLKIGDKIIADKVNMTVSLDTGSTLCYFPAALSQRIADVFNATLDRDTGLYFVDKYPDDVANKTFKFTLAGGATISVPLNEMLLKSDLIVDSYAPSPYVLGFIVTLSNKYVLGSTFLRSSYLAVDLTHMRGAIAQASYASGYNITVMTSSGLQV